MTAPYNDKVGDRLRAIRRFFERWPEYRGRVVFVQIASPSRSRIERYQRLQEITAEMIAGQSDLEVAGNDLDDLPIGIGRAKQLGFAVSTVNAHETPAMGPPRSCRHYRGGTGRVHSFLTLGFAIQRNAIQLKAMADEAIARPLGDAPLQFLDFVVVKFHDLAALDVDQVIVVLVGGFFIARATVSEIVLGQNPRLLEQAHGAIDGGDRDVRVDRDGAAVQFLGIGMVVGFGHHAGDHAALLGHAQALFRACLLDAIQIQCRAIHGSSSGTGTV